jgi:hypothetical protein
MPKKRSLSSIKNANILATEATETSKQAIQSTQESTQSTTQLVSKMSTSEMDAMLAGLLSASTNFDSQNAYEINDKLQNIVDGKGIVVEVPEVPKEAIKEASKKTDKDSLLSTMLAYREHQAANIKKTVVKTESTKRKVKAIEAVVEEVTKNQEAAQLIEANDDIEILANLEAVKTTRGNVTFRLRSNSLPNHVARFVESVVNESQRILKFRGVDVNTITAINNNQLRASSIKLPLTTYIFKPDDKKVKVNKGTRFIFSTIEDKQHDYIIYIQEQSKKTVFVLNEANFESQKEMYKLFRESIIGFYKFGYEVAVNKLTTKSSENKLGIIMEKLASKYNVKPYTIDGQTVSFEVTTKESKNNFIKIFVELDPDSDPTNGLYRIGVTDYLKAKSLSNSDKLIVSSLSIDQLKTKAPKVIDVAFEDTDWSEVFDIPKDLTMYYSNINKLKAGALKDAYMTLYEVAENNPNIVIDAVMSNKEFVELTKRDEYHAEAVIGHTGDVEWNLIYYFKLIKGGDAKGRTSKTVLSSDSYKKLKRLYSNDVPIQQRSKIMKNEGAERLYDARKNLFQLEYKKKGKTEYHIYCAKTFNEIVDDTKFLENNPKYPKSKF